MTIVRRTITPIWRQRRWQRDGESYFGYYRTPLGSCRGRIVRRYRGKWVFLIYEPPECLRSHSHWTCFIRAGHETYEVHFHNRGRSVDDGILAIERILLEAHKEAQFIAANTEDAQEGPRAWVEKREPLFKGR